MTAILVVQSQDARTIGQKTGDGVTILIATVATGTSTESAIGMTISTTQVRPIAVTETVIGTGTEIGAGTRTRTGAATIGGIETEDDLRIRF